MTDSCRLILKYYSPKNTLEILGRGNHCVLHPLKQIPDYIYVYNSFILSVGYGGLSVICHSLAVLTINPSSHITKAFQQVSILK